MSYISQARPWPRAASAACAALQLRRGAHKHPRAGPHQPPPSPPATSLLQVKARPPTFVAFVSGSTPLGAAGTRFLAAQIRKEFGFGGVPLRVTVRAKQPRGERGRQRRRGGGGRR